LSILLHEAKALLKLFCL